MRFGSFKPSSIVLVASCLILTASVASSQSIRADMPKTDGSVRVGLLAPRVSLLGGGGSVTQETNALQKSISSYIEGPRIGTVIIKAKLDSLALEEAKERQCDYVLFISLTRKRKAAQGSRSSYGGGSGSKAGDEILFEYKVVPIDGSQSTAANTLRATVKTDGEDVVTSMVESTAQIVVGLAKSRPVTAAATPAASPKTPSSESKTNNETVAPVSQASNPPAPKGYGSLSAGTSRSTSNRRAVGDPPKAPGTIRIGLAYPKVTGSGANTGAGDAAALRETISSYLAGSNVETIELKARLEGITVTEAQKRECDFVLYLSLDRKRKSSSGGGGGLSAILGTIGGGTIGKKLPGTKEASKVGTDVAKMGVGISALTKANDEMTFGYKLMVSDGTRAVAEKTTTAKAKKDGDDVLTPMIESAAQAIFDATQKNP